MAELAVLPIGSPPGLAIRLPVFNRVRRGVIAIGSAVEWLLGAGTLLVGLAILATVPIVQFLTLGYLLEAAGRVGRRGRLRDAWIDVRRAATVGKIVVGCWLWWLPTRLMASLASSAHWIDPGSRAARIWGWALCVVAVLTLVHLGVSIARGGRLRLFAWPPGNLFWLIRRFRRGGCYVGARDATCDFVFSLRLPYYLKLGALGYAGSMVWLGVPVLLMMLSRRAGIIGLAGALGLGFVALSLPFLQVHYAAEGRFRAIFEAKRVGERFRRAPWAFALAFTITVLAALPLYLFKIERVPREVAGLAGILFVGSLFPARIACGWAYARGGLRDDRRHWFWRGDRSNLHVAGSCPLRLGRLLCSIHVVGRLPELVRTTRLFDSDSNSQRMTRPGYQRLRICPPEDRDGDTIDL